MRGCALLACVAASTAFAQRPDSQEPFPAGGQRGTVVAVTFPGRSLFDPLDLVFERPGLEVLDAVGDAGGREATYRIRVAADAPLGDHAVRMRTRTGLGELHLFHVGALEECAESEDPGARGQNDALDDADEIALERTVNGVISGRDRDTFAVRVERGTLVRCELQAVRLGGAARDLAVTIHDPDGREILEADDSIFGGKDPVCSFRAEVDGLHWIQVRGAVPVQTERRTYRLHVGTFPRPIAVAPLGGRPGESIDLALEGDPDLTAQTVELPRGGGSHEYFPHNERGTAPTPLTLHVSGARRPETEALPPEKEGGAPRELHAFPGVIDGVLEEPGETDRYLFRAKKNDSIEFRLRARRYHSPLDGQIILRYDNGRYITGNDDGRGTGADSRVTFRAPADGIFRVEVRDLMLRGGPDFAYRLFGSTGTPSGFSTRLLVPPRGGVDTIAVPRGGYAGHVVMVSRFDADPLEACLDTLPYGVTATLGDFRKDTPYVPVVLHAAADAPLRHVRARPRAAVGDEQPGFSLGVTLVTGRNQRPYLSHSSNRVVVAVTDAPPFRVTAHPPAVPLAIGSYLPIPVTVERNEGFDESVRVELLWAPPGMTAGATTIAKGKTKGTLYLSAKSSAVADEWPMAVRASARVRGGTHQITSAMFPIRVAQPWVEATVGSSRLAQGENGVLEVSLDWKRSVEGPVELYWRNVPKGLEVAGLEVQPGTEKVRVEIRATASAPKGRHRPLLRMKVPTPDGEVIHQKYGAEVRIDPAQPAPSEAGGQP